MMFAQPRDHLAQRLAAVADLRLGLYVEFRRRLLGIGGK